MFKVSLEISKEDSSPRIISIQEASKDPGFYCCVSRQYIYFVNDGKEVFLLLNGNLYISDINSEDKNKPMLYKATGKIVFKMEN